MYQPMPMKTELRCPTAWRRLAVLPVALFAFSVPAYAHHLEKTFTVDGRPVITVRNAQGKIQVKSWQRSDVAVMADHTSNRVEVDAEQRGNQIEVLTHVLDSTVNPAELTADYQINVPEESELQIKNDSGSVYVERVYGDMTIDTVAATVEVQEISGYLTVRTVEGSFLCRRCAAHLDFSSISGSARLLQPVSSNVRAQTNTGDLFYDGEFLSGGTYSLKNMSGIIEVRFSEGDSLNLTATSVNGKVENQANLQPESHRAPRFSGKFAYFQSGTMNQGLARVELTSFSGTIRIRKRD